jgi:hypothetical protein
MNSGGGRKENFTHCYIEAPEAEARLIFYNRFGHSPDRVSCTCCGADYSVSSHDDLAQLTGFHRGCRNLKTPRRSSGLFANDDPTIRRKLYLEDGEAPPPGYEVDTPILASKGYHTLDQYLNQPDVLVIRAADIKPEERTGDLPEQGYVWVGG